jgi:hypothetical protein
MAMTSQSIANNSIIKYNDNNALDSSNNGIIAVPTDYLNDDGVPYGQPGDWAFGGSEIEASPRFYNFVVQEGQGISQKFIETPHIVDGECKKSVNNMMLLTNDHLVIDHLFTNFFH